MRCSGTLDRVASRSRRDFLQDVLTGLRAPSKELPCKYFYDKRGSELFDRICLLDEYYLTRSELSIMETSAPELGEQIGPGAMVVEFGSGSSVKTRYLLDALSECAAYVPVDISGEHLDIAAAELAVDYPRIEILPVCADFTRPFDLPLPTRRATHAAVYFPGSTIGNFMPERAVELLHRIAVLVGEGGGLIIGIDLKKDVAQIEAAYNDSLGVTARFNLNLLQRINDELEGDFRLDSFEHRAVYNSQLGRVEIDLVSRMDQRVTVAGEAFGFREGEAIRTEYSHKYSVQEFAALSASAGLFLHRQWTDRHDNFAVLHLVVEGQKTSG
jgi:dimethylhistidine N-methyltransferase